jgi:Ca2+-binding RTX toxin-like protein
MWGGGSSGDHQRTASNNTLTGTDDADQINGLAGNDTINPLGRALATVASARDIVDGGDGDDTLVIDASGETQAVQLATASRRASRSPRRRTTSLSKPTTWSG